MSEEHFPLFGLASFSSRHWLQKNHWQSWNLICQLYLTDHFCNSHHRDFNVHQPSTQRPGSYPKSFGPFGLLCPSRIASALSTPLSHLRLYRFLQTIGTVRKPDRRTLQCRVLLARIWNSEQFSRTVWLILFVQLLVSWDLSFYSVFWAWLSRTARLWAHPHRHRHHLGFTNAYGSLGCPRCRSLLLLRARAFYVEVHALVPSGLAGVDSLARHGCSTSWQELEFD